MSGQEIAQDNWYYDQTVNYGLIGYAPASSLWDGLFSNTNTTKYSIALSSQISLSNITIGDFDTDSTSFYQGKESCQISTNYNETVYDFMDILFGNVNYDSNGFAESEYFESIQAVPIVTRKSIFSVSYSGLGLPG